MTYDLICIGAGALGTFSALHAAMAGQKVLVLERNGKAYEGTVRNFGQCVPSGQALPFWRNYGIKTLEVLKQLDANTDIALRRNGSIYIASDETEMTLLEEMQKMNEQSGYNSRMLSASELHQKYPTLRATYPLGGLEYPDEISLEPRKSIHLIMDYMVKELGVHFLPDRPVIACDESDAGCTVRTSRGEIFSSRSVVLCSGSEFRLLFPEIYEQSGMQISKLQMLLLKAIPGLQLPGNILTGYSIRRYEAFHSCPSYATLCSKPKDNEVEKEWGIHILFKQGIDGSIILGDSHEYAPVTAPEQLDFGINQYVNDLILREARKVMDFPVWNVVSTWNGYYSTHPDGVFTHRAGRNIHIVTGIGGKGMSTGAGFTQEYIQQHIL